MVHVPLTYNGSAPVPLVVAFPYLGGTMRGMESLSGLSEKSETEGFIVVYPQPIANLPGWSGTCWNQDTVGLDDVGFISDMLDVLFMDYWIDTTRVYVTGFSMGGGMCYWAAQRLAHRFAAIAPVCAYVENNIMNYQPPARPVAMMQFASQDDNNIWTITPASEYWRRANNCAPQPDTIAAGQNYTVEKWADAANHADVILCTAVSGGHMWPTYEVFGYSATDMMVNFFREHTLAPPFSCFIKITSPPGNAILEAPATIHVAADAEGDAGQVARVEFYRNDSKISEAGSSPYQCVWSNVDTGTYVITVRALDASGRVLNPLQVCTIRVIPRNPNGSIRAFSSTDEPASRPAGNTIDGNSSTRWASLSWDPQWLCIDLGRTAAVKGVTLNWHTAYGTAYAIQVSSDLENWHEVFSTTTGNGRRDTVLFEPVDARFVRMYGTKRATLWGYSLYEFSIDTGQTTAIHESCGNTLPARFELRQNHPNPFNPSTTISYSIPKQSFVSLKVFDLVGREIETLVSEDQNAGEYKVEFHACNHASGLYLIRLQAEGFVDVKKCVLIR
jgi:poly(3-hydroxybutyrate) depolymerase